MKTSTPKPIGGVLESAIQNLGIGERLKKAEVIDRWQDIVGEQIAKVTKPLKIDSGILIVHVTSSVWRNELIFLRLELIAKVNAAVEKGIIRDIIFR